MPSLCATTATYSDETFSHAHPFEFCSVGSKGTQAAFIDDIVRPQWRAASWAKARSFLDIDTVASRKTQRHHMDGTSFSWFSGAKEKHHHSPHRLHQDHQHAPTPQPPYQQYQQPTVGYAQQPQSPGYLQQQQQQQQQQQYSPQQLMQPVPLPGQPIPGQAMPGQPMPQGQVYGQSQSGYQPLPPGQTGYGPQPGQGPPPGQGLEQHASHNDQDGQDHGQDGQDNENHEDHDQDEMDLEDDVSQRRQENGSNLAAIAALGVLPVVGYGSYFLFFRRTPNYAESCGDFPSDDGDYTEDDSLDR